jgi:hypothetical protein
VSKGRNLKKLTFLIFIQFKYSFLQSVHLYVFFCYFIWKRGPNSEILHIWKVHNFIFFIQFWWFFFIVKWIVLRARDMFLWFLDNLIETGRINNREYWRTNQKRTIKRNWQHRTKKCAYFQNFIFLFFIQF